MASRGAASIQHSLRVAVIFFDLGDTIIYQQIDSEVTLDRLPLRLLPHTLQILDAASALCPLGLITNTERSDETVVRRALHELGVDAYFQSVTTSVDVGYKKPAPQPFAVALRKHKVLASSALMVGNSYEEDILPAKQLGLTTVFLARSPGAYPLADHTILAEHRPSLSGLLEAICQH